MLKYLHHRYHKQPSRHKILVGSNSKEAHWDQWACLPQKRH